MPGKYFVLSVISIVTSGILYDTNTNHSFASKIAQSNNSIPAVPAMPSMPAVPTMPSMPAVPTDKVKEWQPVPPQIPSNLVDMIKSLPSLNSVQQKELEQAKSDAQKLIQEEKQRVKPQEFLDKKTEIWRKFALKNQGLQASKSGKLYASLPVTSRPGIFMVSMNDSSASVTSFAGGHGAMVYSNLNTIEAYGNRSSGNGVYYYPNNWETRYQNMVARSVSGTTVDQDKQAAIRASQQVGKAYNYNFWDIDQDNSFYCSQLVYRQFKALFNINLNDNGGAVWPGDLSATKNASTVYSK
jgi:uncharacterized protein YycO